jgi:hypothetical protein
MYDTFKDKGFSIIALNGMDDKVTITKYIKDNHFTFQIGMKEGNQPYNADEQYGVQAYPTNYLIGADGKILFRCVGFDEEGIKKALEKALK